MTSTDRRITAATTGQLGIVTRQQAHAAGVTDGQLRRRVNSGTLKQIGRSTFRLAGASSDPRAALRALILDVGGEVWASGRTAAALHGFDGYRLDEPFDLTILRDRNVQRIGHRIHTTATLGLVDRANVDDIPVLSGARTLIDLARTEPTERLVVAFDCGLRDGRFNESLLHRRIVALRTSGRFGIPRLIEAIDEYEVGRGGHSWLERRFLELIHEAGLPAPCTQQVLTRTADRVVRVDFRFPETNVVVEVLGYRYHRTKEQLERDTARMNALVADGFAVYQFPYATVVEQPDHVVGAVQTALDRGPTRFV